MPLNILDLVSLSFAFSMIGLSVYLTKHIMHIVDLTCDGSVMLGGCLFGTLSLIGVNPIVAFCIAILIGAVAGLVTSILTTYTAIEFPISGLITLAAINTFALKITASGKLHLTKLGLEASGNAIPLNHHLSVIFVVLVVVVIYYKVITSEYGLSIRVFGDGRIISESLGVNSNGILNAGLAFANGLAAAAGALIAHITGTFSITMGTGSIVFGMVAALFGAKIIEPRNPKKAILGCFFGSLLFKFLIEIFSFGDKEASGEYNTLIASVALIFLIASIHDENRKWHLENY